MADCTHGWGQLPIVDCLRCEVERLRADRDALVKAGNGMALWLPFENPATRQWREAKKAVRGDDLDPQPEEGGR